MKKIGVLLSGCGHRDGAEVHESTLALLAIDEAGAEAVCFAPRGPQVFVRDHFTGEETDESRDIFAESARIARGKIRDIATVTSADFDALVIPGGQGAALNLSTFLIDGPKACSVQPEVARVIRETAKDKKPIGAICIAPATVAKVFEDMGLNATLTLGTDPEWLSKLEEMGQKPASCKSGECAVDEENRVVSTPAYMEAKSIGEVKPGIYKLIESIMGML
jgi:enhancing lycopene biosynthesis protein 2